MLKEVARKRDAQWQEMFRLGQTWSVCIEWISMDDFDLEALSWSGAGILWKCRGFKKWWCSAAAFKTQHRSDVSKRATSDAEQNGKITGEVSKTEVRNPYWLDIQILHDWNSLNFGEASCILNNNKKDKTYIQAQNAFQEAYFLKQESISQYLQTLLLFIWASEFAAVAWWARAFQGAACLLHQLGGEAIGAGSLPPYIEGARMVMTPKSSNSWKSPGFRGGL